MLYYILLFLLGFISHYILSKIFKRSKEVHGSIDIDLVTGLCRFKITSDKISEPNKKYAIFKINHDAEISRDEQSI